MDSPGTWHDSDPSTKAEWSKAKNAWAEAAMPQLMQVASNYGASIT